MNKEHELFFDDEDVKNIFDISDTNFKNVIENNLDKLKIPKEYFLKIDKMIIEYHIANKNPELYKKLIQNLKDNSFKIKIEPISEGMGMIYALNMNKMK